MSDATLHRRDFLQSAPVAATALSLAVPPIARAGSADRLAALGGQPVRTTAFPAWPVIADNDRSAWESVLREGKWCRLDGRHALAFEQRYAELTDTKHCVVTANGTSALFAALNAIGVGPGDEVIVPPYTFVATVNVVLLQYALPVFVDTDRSTFQIDAGKIEAAITPRTACILPVHLGGNAADLDAILAIGRKHNVPVIEDACQAHLGEWRGKKLGSWGRGGCFSFQASKNLNSGEGGAVISNDEEFAERCYAFHNNGRGRRAGGFKYAAGGANLRMTEFQAALITQQLVRLEQQSHTRDQNADYLTHLLREIPGIQPARAYDGCTRNAYHLYMFRYDRSQFAGASHAQFLKGLRAEGIPASGGYSPLNQEPFLREVLGSRHYARIYGGDRLKTYWDQNRCPENDQLCDQAVWLTQNTLLASRSDMDEIAAAVRKLQQSAGELAKITA